MGGGGWVEESACVCECASSAGTLFLPTTCSLVQPCVHPALAPRSTSPPATRRPTPPPMRTRPARQNTGYAGVATQTPGRHRAGATSWSPACSSSVPGCCWFARGRAARPPHRGWRVATPAGHHGSAAGRRLLPRLYVKASLSFWLGQAQGGRGRRHGGHVPAASRRVERTRRAGWTGLAPPGRHQRPTHTCIRGSIEPLLPLERGFAGRFGHGPPRMGAAARSSAGPAARVAAGGPPAPAPSPRTERG